MTGRAGRVTLTAMLWGSGPLPGLHQDDIDLAMRHRAVLDELAALGYLPEAHEELDGVASAIGLTNPTLAVRGQPFPQGVEPADDRKAATSWQRRLISSSVLK